jgi:hypothetical protein
MGSVLALVMLAVESNRGSNRPLLDHDAGRVSARSGNLSGMAQCDPHRSIRVGEDACRDD